MPESTASAFFSQSPSLFLSPALLFKHSETDGSLCIVVTGGQHGSKWIRLDYAGT